MKLDDIPQDIEPQVGDILEIEQGDVCFEVRIIGITADGYLCEQDNVQGAILLEGTGLDEADATDIEDFLRSGGRVERIPYKNTRKEKGAAFRFGSKHIGTAGGSGKGKQVSGLGAATSAKSNKPVVTAGYEPEGQEVEEAGPFRSTEPKKPRRGSVADLAARKRAEQDRTPQRQREIDAIGNKNHYVGTARVRHDKSGVEEGNIETQLHQLSKAPDIFDAIYNALTRDDELGRYLQDMYNDVARERRLHPDDDFEDIISSMADQIESSYSKPGVSEGSDLPPKVIEMIKKIAQSSASPEHKKAAIDALVAKYSKQGVAEGSNRDMSDMEHHQKNVERFRKDLALPDRDKPKGNKETDMDHHRKNADRFRKDLGLDKKEGVAEGWPDYDDNQYSLTDSTGKELTLLRGNTPEEAIERAKQLIGSNEKLLATFGLVKLTPRPHYIVRNAKRQGVSEGEGKTQKYEMMMRNGQVKRFTAKDDADAKRIAAGHGAKSVIRMKGNVPGNKIGEQGVAEGVNESTEQSLQKKIQSRRDALGLAREQRRARGQHQQGQREIKLQAEIDDLNDQLRELKKQGVKEGRYFRTAYGYAGGYNEKTGKKYKHPEDIRADREAKQKDKDKEQAEKKPHPDTLKKQGVQEGYTGRETKDGTWRVFKDGKAVAVAGPFKSREEAAAWIKKQKTGVAEGSGPKEKQKTPYRDINSPEYRKAADKQKQQMAKDAAAEPGKKLADKIAKKGVTEGVGGWSGPLYDPDLQKGKKKPKLSDVKVKFPKKPEEKKPQPGVQEGAEEHEYSLSMGNRQRPGSDRLDTDSRSRMDSLRAQEHDLKQRTIDILLKRHPNWERSDLELAPLRELIDMLRKPASEDMDEAKYQGREVPLGKKMAGDVAKSKVYVRKPNGKVVKVNFGDKDMKIKKSNPARRKSFRARHNCDNPGPRWRARYWSCRSW